MRGYRLEGNKSTCSGASDIRWNVINNSISSRCVPERGWTLDGACVTTLWMARWWTSKNVELLYSERRTRGGDYRWDLQVELRVLGGSPESFRRYLGQQNPLAELNMRVPEPFNNENTVPQKWICWYRYKEPYPVCSRGRLRR